MGVLESKQFLAYVARSQAGKDLVCKLMQAEKALANTGITHDMIRFSDSLGECLARMRQDMQGCEEMPMNRHNYQWLSTILRDVYDPNLLADRVRRDALASPCRLVHMMGMRKLLDVTMVRGLSAAGRVTIVHVDAPRELRHRWMCKSAMAKAEPQPSWEEFLETEAQECEIEIDRIADHADFVIRNDTDDPSFEHLLPQVSELARRLGF